GSTPLVSQVPTPRQGLLEQGHRPWRVPPALHGASEHLECLRQAELIVEGAQERDALGTQPFRPCMITLSSRQLAEAREQAGRISLVADLTEQGKAILYQPGGALRISPIFHQR